MLSAFFITDHDPSLVVNGVYDPLLVSISVLIAIFASFFTTRLIDLAKETKFHNYERLAKFTAAAIFSAGIWSMHFIGMLAFSLCTNIKYDPTITILSFLPAFFACLFAISILINNKASFKILGLCSVLLGAGIGTMHYSGMAAMELAPLLRYDPLMFVLSIFVAIALSFIALYSRFNLDKFFPTLTPLQSRTISAIILGLAVAGMHYMGMAATRFVATSPLLFDDINASAGLTFVAIAVATATVAITSVVAVINGMVRYKMLLEEKSADESRLNAILETAIDAIVTIDHRGHILSFNASATHIFGWQEHEVKNKNIKMLMDEKLAKHHDEYLSNAKDVNSNKVLGVNREIFAKHKEGHLFPIRIGIGEVNQPGQTPLYVGYITDLTEQRELQRSLVEKEQKYRSLINNMPGAVFRCRLDDNWSMLFISPSILELTGYQSNEFTEHCLEFNDLILKTDQQAVIDAVTSAVKEKRQYSIEYRIRHRNGKVLWLLDQGSFYFNNKDEAQWIDGVLIDITERKEYEEKLEIAQTDPNAKHIDFKKGLALWGSKCKQLTEITKFIKDNDKRFDTLINEPQLNTQNSYSLIHTLKGIAGNLGLIALMRLLSNLEQAIKQGEDVDNILQSIKAELSVISQLLTTKECDQTDKPESKNNVVSIDELTQLCEALYDSAQNAELNDNALTNLQTFSGEPFSDDIAAIADAFDEFDFENAILKLDTLINKLNDI
ncbi:MHYT domain-containing protein [Pseudoalteromonas sp. ESRF-bin5]|uniref:MHYT domain-containing protein n=1 Tax=Pseudoalteromonas sp. ESRF-bin5 TaxID=2014532 RepID=UPI00257A75CB|nr:MHYT domain-containing protein [Pseudoalteromonas sp. ESRF-bin5]